MWSKGSVPVIWDDNYKNFPYTNQPISDEEIKVWKEQGWYHDTYSGDMYDSKNPMPTYVDRIADAISLTKCGYVFYKMQTLNIMPPHVDHYTKYTEYFKVQYEDVYRAIIFLEDWKPGHYFEIDNKGVVNWSAGDYILWEPGVPHAASNIGKDDRYTLQITGINA